MIAPVRTAVLAVLSGLGCAAWQPSHAEWLNLCDRQAKVSAAQQDKLFRFGAIVRNELDQSGHKLALMARSGLDLQRFGIRYSHAGISLKDSDNTPWSVRQLYYACDEHKPRVYDQGISGFLLGTDNPNVGYISVVLLPEDKSAELERAALDKRQALSVLGASYSANAYPFSARYQNCNQWLIELLATAWGHLDTQEDVLDPAGLRSRAQAWLKDQSYEPANIDVGYRLLMWAGAFIPFVHSDDHPQQDIDARRYRVSMPSAIEAFVHQTIPQATRVEFCHTEDHVVIHRGWRDLRDGCVPDDEDEVIRLD